MKSLDSRSKYTYRPVALFTRAWIEMLFTLAGLVLAGVALFTRAWIEMQIATQISNIGAVALFTRAWIEIQRHVII